MKLIQLICWNSIYLIRLKPFSRWVTSQARDKTSAGHVPGEGYDDKLGIRESKTYLLVSSDHSGWPSIGEVFLKNN